MIDADGSTDGREIFSFVSALVEGADFAKGSRYAPGGGSDDLSRLRSLGNKVLTGLTNLLYGTALHRPVLRLQRLLGPPPGRPRRSTATVSRSRP